MDYRHEIIDPRLNTLDPPHKTLDTSTKSQTPRFLYVLQSFCFID